MTGAVAAPRNAGRGGRRGARSPHRPDTRIDFPEESLDRGKAHERIDGRLRTFIEEQPLLLTATEPLSGDGTVNLSPEGLRESFAVLDENTVA